MIEGDQPSSMFHGKREKIDVGHLARPMNVAGVDAAVVERTGGTGPELVVLGTGRPAQPLDGLERRNRAWILRLTDDADESVLRQSTGRSTVQNFS